MLRSTETDKWNLNYSKSFSNCDNIKDFTLAIKFYLFFYKKVDVKREVNYSAINYFWKWSLLLLKFLDQFINLDLLRKKEESKKRTFLRFFFFFFFYMRIDHQIRTTRKVFPLWTCNPLLYWFWKRCRTSWN